MNKIDQPANISFFSNNYWYICVRHKLITVTIYNLSPLFQVAELNRQDHQYREQITTQVTLAEKLVAGKLSKQQYVENEKSIIAKREDIYKKMEELSTSLN